MNDRHIAYFSMEIALEVGMPTYSGGLGVLAGDSIRSAADLQMPLVAVTLLHRKGYFYQRLDAAGRQTEESVEWVIDDFLQELPARATVMVSGRTVQVRAWEYEVKGISGFVVPVYFLDADLPENEPRDRTLTHWLYGGDAGFRLAQEMVLGMGGVKILRALGYDRLRRFHMNEGHASLLALALLDEEAQKAGRAIFNHDDVETVRRQCVFTTHTPVPEGHDQFPRDLAIQVLGRSEIFDMREVFCCDSVLNMTYVALNVSHYVNGVAKRHGEISQLMFARYAIDSITNGVHAATWTSPPFQTLFDQHIPGWRQDNFHLRYALSIPRLEVWQAHAEAKRQLLRQVNREANLGMDVDFLTLGFARRAATYKRLDLIFSDTERLRNIAAKAGPIQLVFAGKAHPRDEKGKDLIRRVFQARELLKKDIKIAYLENYDLELARLLTAGVDVWLNTPRPPLEASGTSGMKAALNGVPSLSVRDGWWLEGHIEGVTGWSIGEENPGSPAEDDRSPRDAASLYQKLEQVVAPLFYLEPERFQDVMLHAIALNGSFFNTQRMLQQYAVNAYLR